MAFRCPRRRARHGILLAALAFRRRFAASSSATLHLGLGAAAPSALAALALGFVFVLDRGMLTVALALAASGAATVEGRLSIPALRWAMAFRRRPSGSPRGSYPALAAKTFRFGSPRL